MAAADYAQGRDDAPPPLVMAAIKHGAVDRSEYLEQPADLAQRMKTLNYVYRATKGYRHAGAQGQTVAWTQQHPDEWDTVTAIMRLRKEMRDGQ